MMLLWLWLYWLLISLKWFRLYSIIDIELWSILVWVVVLVNWLFRVLWLNRLVSGLIIVLLCDCSFVLSSVMEIVVKFVSSVM